MEILEKELLLMRRLKRLNNRKDIAINEKDIIKVGNIVDQIDILDKELLIVQREINKGSFIFVVTMVPIIVLMHLYLITYLIK